MSNRINNVPNVIVCDIFKNLNGKELAIVSRVQRSWKNCIDGTVPLTQAKNSSKTPWMREHLGGSIG